jgi:DNA-binding MarR family transcriptional regulator
MNPETFAAVSDEVRLVYHQLTRAAESLHVDESVTVAQRAVLEFVERKDSTTVPGIARARGVSRQHIQVHVNELETAGLVDLLPNPAHRRSQLVALTHEGAQTIAGIRKREAAAARTLDVDLSASDVADLVDRLRQLRIALTQLTDGARI